MIKRMLILASLLALGLSATASAGGTGNVYIYDDAITADVDVGRFVDTGEVKYLTGIGNFCNNDEGPAPEPYPQIHVWESGYERLGYSNVEMDGIWFINLGRHWVKNQLALVLWKIRVPHANLRNASEFDEDLTLSMWVDWDQDEMWDKGELEIRKNVNISHCFPTTKNTLCIYYLTAFHVPDVTQMASSDWWWWKKWNKDIRYLWVRGSLACDDPDVSPDGEQLFGEAEDYRVSYMVIEKKAKED
jgi:hypothetical protein